MIEPTTGLPTVALMGIRYHNVSQTETLDIMETWIATGGAHQICTPNVDHPVRAATDPEFSMVMARANLVVADGMGVVYASRFLGTPLKQNVGGRLLLDGFAARAQTKGYRLFLLGGRGTDAVERAAACLEARYPGLVVTGTYAPPFMPELDEPETRRMLAAIYAARPDALFVGLGTPKQEKWIARNLPRLEVPVSIGVGASVDMLAGDVRVPPPWMTEVGLEWLFKTWQEPRRFWRRYLIDDPVFFWWVLRTRVSRRSRLAGPIRARQKPPHRRSGPGPPSS